MPTMVRNAKSKKRDTKHKKSDMKYPNFSFFTFCDHFRVFRDKYRVCYLKCNPKTRTRQKRYTGGKKMILFYRRCWNWIPKTFLHINVRRLRFWNTIRSVWGGIRWISSVILWWESTFTLELKAAKIIDYIKKFFKWKLLSIQFRTKNSVDPHFYLPQEWS